MFVNDAVTQAQAQTCSLPHLLGRKKRIEYFGQVGFCDARPIVLENDPDTVALALAVDADPAAGPMSFDGLARVVNDVDEHLLNLVRIEHDLWQFRVQPSDDLDVARAHLVLKNLNGPFRQLVEIGEFALRLMTPGKTQQALHDLLAPERALMDHRHEMLVLRFNVSFLKQ